MLLEVAVHDSKGTKRGRVRLDLVFDKTQKAGNWEVQEVLESDGWSKVSFSNPSRGRFEVKDRGTIWLWDREPGGAKDRNIVILHDAPTKEGDFKDTNKKPGQGRIYDPKDAAFKDGKAAWTLSGLTPLRKRILDIIARVFPAWPGCLPIPNLIDHSTGYTGHVTNCGALPGWIARQLGYYLPGQSPARKNALKDDITPHKVSSNEFIRLNQSDRDKLAVTSSMVAAWGDDHWSKLRSSYPKALERARGLPEGTIRKDYYKKEEMKKNDVRPKPGDFYTLVGMVPVKKGGPYVWGLAHVGVIIDPSGDVWKTADCGQCGQNAAAYKTRKFNLADGTLKVDPPESTDSPDGGQRYLDGWIDVDQLFSDWE
jgi:hypothetical protein